MSVEPSTYRFSQLILAAIRDNLEQLSAAWHVPGVGRFFVTLTLQFLLSVACTVKNVSQNDVCHGRS